jgi:branched-chain amino acid transport system permease protein
VPELLFTFGLSFIIVELVQVIWGRPPVPNELPPSLQGSLFTIYTTTFPISRGFIMLIAVLMMAALWLALKRTRIGLVIQAALTHPEQVAALGHNVRQVFMLVFGGGSALAGLAGVIGGVVFVTEPSMAAVAGAIIFVVIVVGGMGSLAGAFIASLLIGIIQTFGLALDYSIEGILENIGVHMTPDTFGYAVWKLTIAQVAPVLPFVLLVLILIVRPRGLMGTREG